MNVAVARGLDSSASRRHSLRALLGEGAVRVLQPELLGFGGMPPAAAGRAVEVQMPVQVDVRGRAAVAVATAEDAW